MVNLPALDSIAVPDPKPEQVYSQTLLGEPASFRGLKALLGAADFSKAGDRNAGLAADNERKREAARTILSSLTLGHLYEHPLTDDEGRVDTVMRANYAIDLNRFATVSHLTIGQFKDWLLAGEPAELAGIGPALTGVMAAAVAKICDVHELIAIARKIRHPTRARTTLGLPGTAFFALAAQSSDRRSARHHAVGLLGAFPGSGRCVDRREPRRRYGRKRVGDAGLARSAAAANRRPNADLRAEPHQDATGLPGARCAGRDPVPKPGRHRKHPDQGIRRDGRPARPRLSHDGGPRSAGGPGPAVHVLRNRPRQRVHLRQAQRHRHGHDRGPLLRPGPPLRSVHGQQRHRLHRARNACRQFRDDRRQPAGPLHGQAARPADGHGPLLHPALRHHARRPADGYRAADRGRRELLHGRLSEHRPHAGLLRHQRARQSNPARSLRLEARAGVSRLGHRSRHLSSPGRRRHGARTAVGKRAAILRFRRRAGRPGRRHALGLRIQHRRPAAG